MPINPIRTDTNDFAKDTFARRLPVIAREIKHRNPRITAKMKADIDALIKQLKSNATIPLPPLSTPDAQTWLDVYEHHKGETWQASEFFFAEHYFFHLLIDIVRYWAVRADPFLRQKRHALENPNLYIIIDKALSIHAEPEERLARLLELSLWGNRFDLSLPEVMARLDQETADEDLLVDERQKAVERLLSKHGTVHLVTDNFGAELIMDLALADALLSLSIPVTFHPKMHPTYVSDTVAQEIPNSVFSYLRSHDGELVDRLEAAFHNGRFTIAPNFFWNSPHFLDKLPMPLKKLFEDASLLIFKGDVNYRRAFFDTIWHVDMPAQDIVNYLPAPALFLRTLKSDCLAGVPKELAEKAEAANPNWRRLGKYGLIQYINISSHT